jgi:hypothetical protein
MTTSLLGRHCARLGLLLAPLCLLPGLSLEKRQFVSPINGKPFDAEVIPLVKGGGLRSDAGDADMGTDSDGCRHSSGPSEYDYYVLTDPHSYFSALSTEWDERGRFRAQLPEGLPAWIASKDGFFPEWTVDRTQNYKRWQFNNARQQPPKPMPALENWVMAQNEIVLGKKYRLAIVSYHQRRYSPGFQGKLALSGAWAIRARLNKPVDHPRLAGGIQEISAKVEAEIKDGEVFNVAKWTNIYRDLYESRTLTTEGRFVAAMVYLGFVLREGEVAEAQKIITDTLERLQDNPEAEILRGLLRERRGMIIEYYMPFLEQAAFNLRSGLATEENPRPHVPEIVWAIAESLRRMGKNAEAADWYLCLARMPETQPAMRDELRTQRKAPGADATYLMSLGWRADEALARIDKGTPRTAFAASGEERELLDAIATGGLGTETYISPRWKPEQNRDARYAEWVLSQVGLATLDYRFRVGTWPDALNDLWMEGYIKNRNVVNRFHCPSSGSPYAYIRPKEEQLAPRTVVVATMKPVRLGDGDRYAAFLSNNEVVYGPAPFLPGEVVPAPGGPNSGPQAGLVGPGGAPPVAPAPVPRR